MEWDSTIWILSIIVTFVLVAVYKLISLCVIWIIASFRAWRDHHTSTPRLKEKRTARHAFFNSKAYLFVLFLVLYVVLHTVIPSFQQTVLVKFRAVVWAGIFSFSLLIFLAIELFRNSSIRGMAKQGFEEVKKRGKMKRKKQDNPEPAGGE